MSDIENAKIRSTMLGIEDHGILTFYLHIEANGWGQGVGGYCLDGANPEKDHTKPRPGFGPGLTAIRQILETVGVDRWEKLPGTLIRVRRTGDWGSALPPIIGHIIEDRWFDLKAFMETQSK